MVASSESMSRASASVIGHEAHPHFSTALNAWWMRLVNLTGLEPDPTYQHGTSWATSMCPALRTRCNDFSIPASNHTHEPDGPEENQTLSPTMLPDRS